MGESRREGGILLNQEELSGRYNPTTVEEASLNSQRMGRHERSGAGEEKLEEREKLEKKQSE